MPGFSVMKGSKPLFEIENNLKESKKIKIKLK